METLKKIDADLVIFDLDGTLIDSSADIAWCANKTLNSFGYPSRGVEEIKKDIGWGVKNLLERLMPKEPPSRIDEGRLKFLEFYAGRLVVDTHVYPGVMETLDWLRARGKKLSCVTNKPAGLSDKILTILGLRDAFMSVVGGDSYPNRKPHPEPVEAVIASAGVSPVKAVVVGDSPIDCEAGQAAGAFTVGVTWGFRDRVELTACDAVIDDMREIKEIIV
ncbi:MAG: HAD-IA family hydrolase [Deltaproteobacteria bacterium]|nr:HAD-IA family hydrolase [Deltaproteobacteria bacterium]